MTYQDDPNGNLRRNQARADGASYTGWIVGGVVAVAVILGVFLMTGRTNDTAASNSSNRPQVTAPTTTGSAVPAPSSGLGTAGAPSQNQPTPTVPAR